MAYGVPHKAGRKATNRYTFGARSRLGRGEYVPPGGGPGPGPNDLTHDGILITHDGAQVTYTP